MSTETLESNQTPSFEGFKKTILQQGADADFLSRVANLHGRIPRLIRILNNFDPTGTLGAIEQVLNEEKTEQEQDNILRAIYDLAIKIWKVDVAALPSLPNDKFKFLYFVYVKSETDVFRIVEADEIQNVLGLPQQRIISIGGYLDKNGLIKFNTWVTGIHIVHKGVVRVEADLLGNNELPEYVSVNEVKKLEERIRLRFDLLQELNRETDGDTFKLIPHTDLASKLGLDHHRVISQFLPYMDGEGWIKCITSDSVTITEEGIDKAKALFTYTSQQQHVHNIDIQQKRAELLHRLHMVSNASPITSVSIKSLREDLGLDEEEFNSLSYYWLQKGLLDFPTFGNVQITVSGIDYVESHPVSTYQVRTTNQSLKPLSSQSDKHAPKVFLCYSKQDKSQVKELYQALKEAGLEPWLDEFNLLPGQDWELEIKRAVQTADFFLACLSKNSVDKRGYLQKEIKMGLEILGQMPEGKIYLIPVRLEECEVPDRLRNRHWVDIFVSDGFDKLVAAIKKH